MTITKGNIICMKQNEQIIDKHWDGKRMKGWKTDEGMAMKTEELT